ncbi:MAG: GatB/YqeY domain-containing protein [Nocardioidaceae bacterium]|nr:GatB/YqeY domain-containing protein [Nocardioidaceae bacterium]
MSTYRNPSGSLKERLRADLTTAMKARDGLRSSTIRMILTSVANAEVAGKVAKELSDDEVLTVLASEAKRRREAAVAFEEGGRAESAAKERAEAEVIADYLPVQLGPEEISAIVTAVVDELGVAGAGGKAMGQVRGKVTPQVKGRADGAAVAAEVRRQLG